MAKQKQIEIVPPKINTAIFHIEGLSPYLADGIPPGAMEGMKQPGSSKAVKVEQPVVELTPEQKASARVTWFTNGKKPEDNIPAIKGAAFQGSMINACRRVPNLSMTQASGIFFVEQHLIPFTYDEMEFTTHIGRRPPGPRGTPAEIFRYAFHGWKCEIPIAYEANQIRLDMLIQLLNYAGLTVGVGGWRPEKKGGTFGRFKVAKVEAEEEVLQDE